MSRAVEGGPVILVVVVVESAGSSNVSRPVIIALALGAANNIPNIGRRTNARPFVRVDECLMEVEKLDDLQRDADQLARA